MQQRFSEIAQPEADEDEKLQELTASAENELTKNLVDEALLEDLREAAYQIMRSKVLRLRFLGGCPRDMTSDCPRSWSQVEGGACAPPTGYDGLCGDIVFSKPSMSASDKEELSLKCRAEWPCTPACAKNLQGCPNDWEDFEGLCVAPEHYDGMCSPAMDFQTWSNRQKSDWAALCGADWPCLEENLAGLPTSVAGGGAGAAAASGSGPAANGPV